MFENKYFLLFLISFNILGTYGSWLVSCKPCLEALLRCNKCTDFNECSVCFDGICPKCLNDIFNFGSSYFYCDSLIEYHNASCNYYCKPSSALYGYCDYLNGICKCITADSSSTTTSSPTTISETSTNLITSEEPSTSTLTSTNRITTTETTTTNRITTTETSSLATTTKWNKNLWKSSCVPCTDVLEECSTCLKEECYTCVQGISNTNCLKCMDDIIPLPLNFECVTADYFSNLVCKIRCRMNGLITYKSGKCNNKQPPTCVCSLI